ncbi:hypothetical protein SISSUDRAFT_302879 [Sistotremastrum suecicum HHB10207 ss-3]|uniref:Uncharacterized protein n=1 Tax=Sistotremastrum suecicum HHB10207 ss-3 TaxID=1314776 RepID=A0A166G666_9AGAM|nr:hypothetical protein SISSUDRAFT_302879 [Sistotremastrum suecicum HHB10207 ss-3]
MTSDQESLSVADSVASPSPGTSKTRRAESSSDEDEDDDYQQPRPKIRRVGPKRVATPDSSEEEDYTYNPDAWRRAPRYFEREVSPAGSLFSVPNPEELRWNNLPAHILRKERPLVAHLSYEAEKATLDRGIATKAKLISGQKRPKELVGVPTKRIGSLLSFDKSKGLRTIKGKYYKEKFPSGSTPSNATSSNSNTNDWTEFFGPEDEGDDPATTFDDFSEPSHPPPPRVPPTPDELLRLANYCEDDAEELEDFDDGDNDAEEEDDLYVTPVAVIPVVLDVQQNSSPALQVDQRQNSDGWKMNRKFLETPSAAPVMSVTCHEYCPCFFVSLINSFRHSGSYGALDLRLRDSLMLSVLVEETRPSLNPVFDPPVYMKTVLLQVDSLELQVPSLCPIDEHSLDEWTVGGAYGKLTLRDTGDGRARLTHESLCKYLDARPCFVLFGSLSTPQSNSGLAVFSSSDKQVCKLLGLPSRSQLIGIENTLLVMHVIPDVNSISQMSMLDDFA